MLLKRKKLLISGAVCAVLMALSLLLAWITLLSLGDIFGGLSSLLGEDTAKTLSDIFSQTRKSRIGLHIPLPLLCAVLLFWLFSRQKSSRGAQVLTIIAAVLGFLVMYIAALLLSRVNDIRFIDLILSLVRMVQDGLFDAL